MKNIRNYVMALALGAAAFAATGSLQAAYTSSEKVKVNFDFRVYNKVMPAGEYRIERDSASNFVMLVNTKTNQRVQVVRSVVQHEPSKDYLRFEKEANGYKLRW